VGGRRRRRPELPAAVPGSAAAAREDRGDRRPNLRRFGVDEFPAATKALALYEGLGFGNLPICMAKTQYSLSHDASLKGRPSGFRVPIRRGSIAGRAGFITPLAGDMRTMPGLPSHPAGEKIDIDADGNIQGLF